MGPETARAGVVPAVEAAGITKTFGHLEVLRGVSASIYRGQITAVVGDNGAGKSTFMKMLSGEYTPDGGQLKIDGIPTHFRSTLDAQKLGIETVYQDLALAPDLSVSDNIFLGRELKRPGLGGRLGMVDRRRMLDASVETLNTLGVRIKSYHAATSSLSGGQRQGVAIARAMRWARHAILLDEPTAALGARQRDMVYKAIRTAAENNLAVLLISHDLPQVLELAHRIIVMRQGVVVADLNPVGLTVREMVDVMLGAGEAA